MKIFVAGATGFIGKAVAYALRAQGHEITAQGRDKEKCQKLREDGFKVIEASDQDQSSIEKACLEQDIIVNCAGLSKVFGRSIDFQHANVDFVNALIRGCLTENTRRKAIGIEDEIRLIQVSSASLYFDYQDHHNISENSALPTKFACDYTKSKYEAEQLIHSSPIQATILRSHFMMGDGDSLIVPPLLNFLKLSSLPVFREGQVDIDVTCIENFVSAVLCCIDKKESIGQTFNITNGEPQKLIDLLNKIADSLDFAIPTMHSPLSFTILRPFISFLEMVTKFVLHPLGFDPDLFLNQFATGTIACDFTVDITHAKETIGYHPNTKIEECLRNAAEWYKGALPFFGAKKALTKSSNSITEDSLDRPTKSPFHCPK